MFHENCITKAILDSAFQMHSDLGPGLLETVYERILKAELIRHGHRVRNQVPIQINYNGLTIEEGFRADLIVDEIVLVELKATEANHPVYYRQLLSYLKLSSMRWALLINFGSEHLKNGIKRVLNGSPALT
jgi:GxxExxY protein